MQQLDKEENRREVEQEWFDRFIVGTFDPLKKFQHPLELTDCPFLDVLEDYTQQALRVGIFEDVAVLQDPVGRMRAAQLFDPRVVRFMGDVKPTRSEKRRLREILDALEIEGVGAHAFSLNYGHDGGSNYVKAQWILLDDIYYTAAFSNRWNSREFFVTAAASNLREH
ncbi:hypothetical protein [Actinokineospora spheciospongiae]|uniref:hypothetical protein n=1 Tax=Actinokineospora spheciospongiae TaxID=909613 RepID=UPI00126801DC|nr:hypothetical protein [Actinokineospora spheciospongiae]